MLYSTLKGTNQTVHCFAIGCSTLKSYYIFATLSLSSRVLHMPFNVEHVSECVL